jgi:hypothetical protein
VAALSAAGSPTDVGRGVLAALRSGEAARLASFVESVCGGAGGGPDAVSARVGAALRALAAASDPTTPTATAALEALLSRPGLEAVLDPADAVGGAYLHGRVPAPVLAAWARAAAAWLGGEQVSNTTSTAAATPRAVWLAQCAAVVESGGAGADGAASPSFAPILAAGLGAAGAALLLPAATAVATALLTRAPGVPPDLAVRAVRALADGAGPDRGPGLLAASGAAAVRAAAAGALVDGRSSDGKAGKSDSDVLAAARAVMGEGGVAHRPDVARALAVLAAVERW